MKLAYDTVMVNTHHCASVKTRSITPRVNPNVNYRLTDSDVSINVDSPSVTNLPRWWGILLVGEVVHMWRQGYMGTLCTVRSIFP